MAGHYEWKNGKKVWVEDKPSPKPKPKPGNNKPGTPNTPSGPSGPTAAQTAAANERAAASARELKEKAVDEAFNRLFREGKAGKFKPTKELYDAAIKGNWDITRISGWVRTHMREAWAATDEAKTRAENLNKELDGIFGSFKPGSVEAKAVALLIKKYVYGQSDDVYKFIDDVVTNPKSKFFAKMFPGWELFYARVGGNKLQAIQAYQNLKLEMQAKYREVLAKPDAEIDNELLQKAMEMNWTTTDLENWVKANDPAWLNTGGATERGSQLKDFWNTLFGDKVKLSQEMLDAFKKSTVDLGTFFSDNIETMAEFETLFPGYQDWKKAQFGIDEGGETDVHVNPLDYFKRRQELKQLYEIYSETPGSENAELIEKALANNWSNERFHLEFKATDPLYSKSSEARVKTNEFTNYWKGLFGSGATPDASLLTEYMQSNDDDPAVMFDKIRGTGIFRAQYGSWDEFAAAQDAAGNTSVILDNPAMYKRYQDAFRDAFSNIGMAPPTGFETMFFRSGMDDTDIKQNLETYISAEQSQQWMTGKKTDLQTAAGLGDATAGGDLRMRMNKALAAHRKYASSEFTAPRSQEEQGSGLITQKI